MLVMAVAIGCGKKGQVTSEADSEHQHEEENQHEGVVHHEHTAPHGGTLVVFGEEFAHLEFVLDAESGKLTAYALDGEAENPVRLSQPNIQCHIHRDDTGSQTVLELGAVADVLTGESLGDTSEFAGQSEALKGATEFEAGEIIVKFREGITVTSTMTNHVNNSKATIVTVNYSLQCWKNWNSFKRTARGTMK